MTRKQTREPRNEKPATRMEKLEPDQLQQIAGGDVYMHNPRGGGNHLIGPG